MTDTQWADVSQFNPLANDQYKLRGIAIRSNDGTYRDTHFANNVAWAKHACDTGKLDFFIVYLVYEINWRETLATFKSMVGKPHPKMAVMIDMESWGGRIASDQSPEANELRNEIAVWLGGYMSVAAKALRKHYKRVVGYANANDFAKLWAKRSSDMLVVLANYTSNPAFPNKLAHQYSDKVACAPFGACDMNSADGMTSMQVVQALGLDATPVPVPPKPPVVTPSAEPFYGAGYEKAIVSPNRQHALIIFDDGRISHYKNGQWVKNLG